MIINQKAINTFRVLSAEIIAGRGTGDTKQCFALAPIMFTLFKDNYYSVIGETCINRDRVVVCDDDLTPLYYSILCGFEFGININDLKDFAKQKTDLAKNNLDNLLGQKEHNFANAVGLAIAEKKLEKQFNVQKFNIISNYTYCFASLKNLEEGVVAESAELAGKYKLEKLVCFVNIDKTHQKEAINLTNKFEAYGWNVKKIKHFNNYFMNSLLFKKITLSSKPTLIIVYSDLKNEAKKIQIKHKVLKDYEVEKLKADFGLNKSFYISNDVHSLCLKTERRLKVDYSKWQRKVVLYKNTHPQLSEELNNYFDKPKIHFAKILKTKPNEKTTLIDVNSEILNIISSVWHSFIGGSSDLALFNKTKNKNSTSFSSSNPRGKNIWFGSRAEAMTDICVGISSYFGSPTYTASKLSKIYSMLDGIEIAVKNNLQTLFIFEKDCEIDLNIFKSSKSITFFEPKTITELVAFYSFYCSNEKPAILVLNNKEIDYSFENYIEVRKQMLAQIDKVKKVK